MRTNSPTIPSAGYFVYLCPIVFGRILSSQGIRWWEDTVRQIKAALDADHRFDRARMPTSSTEQPERRIAASKTESFLAFLA
jgi:hypothetical protein